MLDLRVERTVAQSLAGSWTMMAYISYLNISGVNGKPVYRISFCLGRNDEICKEYLSTGY